MTIEQIEELILKYINYNRESEKNKKTDALKQKLQAVVNDSASTENEKQIARNKLKLIND